MNINLVQNFSLNKFSGHINDKKSKSAQVSFGAHADFDKLKYLYDVTASSYFRRGPFYGSSSKEFDDIVKILKQLFLIKGTQKKTMLISGIADSQEPFSYLAVIKDLIKNKNLEEILELNINDLQSKPTRRKLFEDSFYGNRFSMPEYAPSSFVTDDNYHYRINSEIFKFLHNTYNNKKQSKWEKPIQKAIKEYSDNSFDIISVNNTLGYIAGVTENWKTVISETLQDIYRTLKSGGVFITDPDSSNRLVEAGLMDKFTEIFNGIYIKK